MIRRLLANRKNREKIAIIENDKAVSYRSLIDQARLLQEHLPQNSQENIAIILPDNGSYIAAFWGIIASGMTVFPINIQMTAHEIAPLLVHACVTTVITETAYRRLFNPPELETLSLNIIYIDELEPTVCKTAFAEADINPDAPMLLLSTSGTTGKCKIVQLSEKNVESSVLGYLDKLQLEETELDGKRFMLAVPFSSVYGIMILSACLMRSFPIVILAQPFTLDSLYRTAEKHNVTNYEGSATPILLMEQTIGKPIPYDISTLTCFGFGGSKVSGSVIESLRDVYSGMEFFQGYGMTEAAPLITKHPRAKLEKTESVGTAIKGLEIAVEANGKIVHTPYTTGEIVVKGANVMLGYYNNEPETKQVLKNGYLYTGDVGYLDGEGYLYICGRKKNMIVVRGFNVYPEEVEDCILNSQLAKDCVVYGQTDDSGNEIVCADIIPMHPKVQAGEIISYCRAHLADYKQPKNIFLCRHIKKNITGKTERRKERST